MTLTEFLEARISEDEAMATPRTVVISGGSPAAEVPNCIGATGHGCPDGWFLDGTGKPTRWWCEPDPQSQIAAHELTHATPDQTRRLAECAAKRAILALHNPSGDPRDCENDSAGNPYWEPTLEPCPTLRALASVDADHPDYREEWRP